MIHSLTNDPSTMGFLSRKCDCNFNDSQVDHANGKEIVSLLGQFFFTGVTWQLSQHRG